MRSDEEGIIAGSMEGSSLASSSSESDKQEEVNIVESEDIDVGPRKGTDVLQIIHDQLDLERLQQVR